MTLASTHQLPSIGVEVHFQSYFVVLSSVKTNCILIISQTDGMFDEQEIYWLTAREQGVISAPSRVEKR